jgi:hypothetical protein
MGLKGYRLWAMGQLDSTCSAPPRAHLRLRRFRFAQELLLHRRVAVPVEFAR